MGSHDALQTRADTLFTVLILINDGTLKEELLGGV